MDARPGAPDRRSPVRARTIVEAWVAGLQDVKPARRAGFVAAGGETVLLRAASRLPWAKGDQGRRRER